MFSNLFKKTPVVDSNSHNWILDTFVWALENFELPVFKNETQLILPTNEFYPGNVNSVHEMAQSVFDKTLEYAGLQHWPIVLVAPDNIEQQTLPALDFVDIKRGEAVKFHTELTAEQSIKVSYNPNQVNQPQDLVASFAQAFAMIVIVHSGRTPPGGAEFLPQAVELVACFMGFGVMFSNTAYQFKGGCGSCFNPYANRNVSLSENDMVYCLALFSVLKQKKIKDASPFLKSHLRTSFKKSYKELQSSINDNTQPVLVAAMAK